MMKPPYVALVWAAGVATSPGCSSGPARGRPGSVGASAPVAARLLDAEVARKMQANTMSEEVKAPPPVLIGPVVTIDKYQGDAAILLKRIAAANGKAFEVIGT